MRLTDPDALCVHDSPVFAEFQRQRGNGGERTLHDLAALWRAAGRPRGKSPRHWDSWNIKAGCPSEIVADLGGRDGPVLAAGPSALDYAQALDDAGVLASVPASCTGRSWRLARSWYSAACRRWWNTGSLAAG